MPDQPDEHLPPDATRATPRGGKAGGARRIGPYRIEGELGRGGMGVVHRAFDERLHRDVALKALPAELASDPSQLARLTREARALALVSHANVASIHGMEEAEGATYLVLELVPGETLRARLDRGRLAHDEALSLCSQVAAGLAAVHAKGMVHRDLKPSNVMVTPDGIAKLLDFGLARQAREAARGEVTRHGDVMGTSGWMSPEQLRGEELDARSDAFAWGCLLYECLAGAAAFPGKTWTDRDAAVLKDEPAWERLPELHPTVAGLLRSCLSKERADRPVTLEDARRVLEDARQRSTERRALAALPKHSLPAERDAFVGREAELQELGQLLDAGHRLVSVLGIGGTGKTRLVQHHARRSLPQWPGGTWFCDLSEARSLAGIVSAMASALDVPLAKGDPVAQLGHAIAGRGKCLVILDNFEQVARHAGETVGAWLDRCEEATFVVTTREVLGLAGEQSLALAPLGQADAEALFVARARQVRPGYEPDADEREVIARLVRLLDHLPLALELAAARLRVMPPKQLLARMGERFKLLSGGGARRDRQATLRATLDWSWELLAEWERSALAQLSVFEGGFTLEAAEEVLDLSAWADAPWPMDVVQALLDKSLVRRVSDDRFDLLVSVQEYAAEKLDAAGARAATEQRHGAWCATLGAPEALAAVDRRGGAEMRRVLGRELDNLVAACRRATARGDAEVAVPALRAAWGVIEVRGPFAVAEAMASATLALDLTPASRATVEGIRGQALDFLGRGAEGVACLESALACARESGDRRCEAGALTSLGALLHRQGRIDDARAGLEAALAVARDAGATELEGGALAVLGLLHHEQARTSEARACYESALARHREAGNRRGEGLVLGNLGNMNAQQGRADEARACWDACLAIQRETGNRRMEALVLGNLTQYFFDHALLAEARTAIESALALSREIGDRRIEGMLLGNLGALLLEERHPQEGLASFEASIAIHREMGNARLEAMVLVNMIGVHRMQGRPDEALACGDAALRIFREAGDSRMLGITLGYAGNLHAATGHRDQARRSFEEAERLLRDSGDPVQCAIVLCARARFDLDEGRVEAARAAVEEADAMRVRAGVGEDTPLGRDVRSIRARLAGEAS